MKRKSKSTQSAQWTLTDVKRALPLINSILRTVRDAVIQGNALDCAIKKLTNRPGRLSRHGMIELANLKAQQANVDTTIMDAIEEMQQIGAYCFDPIQAVAAFPFFVGDMHFGVRPAWFLYNLFGEDLYWRFDDEDIRRDLCDIREAD